MRNVRNGVSWVRTQREQCGEKSEANFNSVNNYENP